MIVISNGNTKSVSGVRSNSYCVTIDVSDPTDQRSDTLATDGSGYYMHGHIC